MGNLFNQGRGYMTGILNFLLITISLTSFCYGQDLLQERIWKISSKKRSIFFDKGVFHSQQNLDKQQLKGIRNSFVASRGYERIVFDFTTNKPPKVYGKISSK